MSPVRLYIHLVFPAENDNTFTLDLELKGVVEVETSKVSMMGTKLEVKMKKILEFNYELFLGDDNSEVMIEPVMDSSYCIHNVTAQTGTNSEMKDESKHVFYQV